MSTAKTKSVIGPDADDQLWVNAPEHHDWLKAQSQSLLTFFDASLQDKPGFATLDHQGRPLPDTVQELHTTTRLVHAYALGMRQGHKGADRLVDQGIAYLQNAHKDQKHGGFLWAIDGDDIADSRKLAYGHVFVLLAASSAKLVGHADADALIAEISGVLDEHFWDEDAGLFVDEWNRDWTPFSTYRGMNANMHGVEALLAAFEATGDGKYLSRADRILNFFIRDLAPQENWRLPEHFTDSWQIDRSYAGDHMFRPFGTTPGHSFEMGRLMLHHWDLSGRPKKDAPHLARNLIMQGLTDAWLPDGGLAYTLKFDGSVADGARFWWPVTEAINALAALLLVDGQAGDDEWYRKLWTFADARFIDHQNGGWFPAIDDQGLPTSSIFAGKPDIYHALQACIFPRSGRMSRMV